MTNFEKAQKIGWDVVSNLMDGKRPDLMMLGMIKTIMELTAAIADKLGVSNNPMQREEDE